ncbi:MAG: DivIVA domain-containing protein [Lactobacillus sp.]|jgi:DivIVA domain-containing protein
MAETNQVKLTADDILKKRFRKSMKGYDQEEVDSFLDQVISDYQAYDSIIDSLQDQIEQLQSSLKEDYEKDSDQEETNQHEEVKTYAPQHAQVAPKQSLDGGNPETTNLAILQRLSALESKVFNLEQKIDHQGGTYASN